MAQETKVYIGCDHELKFGKVKTSAGFRNAGTCLYTMTEVANDGSETQLTTGTLNYVAASDGDYKVSLESDVTRQLEEGRLYYIDVTFEQGSDNAHKRMRLRAAYQS